KRALDRGVKIRLLTGNYLGITQPSALCLLKNELNDRVDLRFYNDQHRSFHPKAYIFHYEESSEIYIGSSNISRSALTSGIEWNYRFSSSFDKVNYEKFYATFEELFYHHSIVIDDEVLESYSKSWKKPAVQKDLDSYEQNAAKDITWKDTNVTALYEPRGAQIEALYALKASRAEGAKKGLVHAATGIGKTYLAAFDSANYKRVLFVAHLEEILYQAADSFKNVRQTEDYGFFFGKQKDTDKSVIFASVATLGREEYLNETYFARDYFDYIVIDEFHHAVNDQYKRIIEYFKPKYMLGLTATPERLDGRNIYELCDYIVPYQITLNQAINKGMLVPFRYYGIYDDTVDYDKIHMARGHYVEAELTEKLMDERRYELIYKHYMKYRSRCAIGFCCSRTHADAMAKAFVERNVSAAAVYSGSMGEYAMERSEAIKKLKTGEVNILFCVDMFNEGLDVPGVDMVLFLRPTESPTIFLQQLGRGLRKEKGKDYLNVLDFIGNYKKASNAPFLLSGKQYSRSEAEKNNQQDYEFPDDCIVDFDMRLVDLFKAMAKRGVKKQELIKEEYFRIKEELDGKVPTRIDLFTYMEDEILELCFKNAPISPFSNYIEYLSSLNELSGDRLELANGIGKEFIHLIETTSMSKSYKMPILLAFYNDGNVKMDLTEEDIYQSYYSFYHDGLNYRDLLSDTNPDGCESWTRERYIKEAKKNPIKFLLKSGQGFFIEKEGYELSLKEELRDVIHAPGFAAEMKDAIDLRVMRYYRSRFLD
ncbi:MAG: DEAD/DEAH box helicase family protein, partial [bacterium]|nr:DEAD/DEAH box helicase family protein [bacterium]